MAEDKNVRLVSVEVYAIFIYFFGFCPFVIHSEFTFDALNLKLIIDKSN